MKRNMKRISAMLLALVMMFSVLPTGTFAAGSDGIIAAHRGVDTSEFSYPRTDSNWNTAWGQSFMRFTLIEFPDGVVGGNADTHWVVGRSFNIYNLDEWSVTPYLTEDVMSHSQGEGEYVLWPTSNAQGYLDNMSELDDGLAYFNDILADCQIFDGYWETDGNGSGNYPHQFSIGGTPIWSPYTVSATQFANRAGVETADVQRFSYAGASICSESETGWPLGVNGRREWGTNFADPGSGVSINGVPVYEPNVDILGTLLLELTKYNLNFPEWYDLTCGGLDPDTGKWEKTAKKQAVDLFINSLSSNGTTRYRILAEPGYFLKNKDSNLWYALTVRDALAFNKKFFGDVNDSPLKGGSGNLFNKCINLTIAEKEYREYPVDADGNPYGDPKPSTPFFMKPNTLFDDISTDAKGLRLALAAVYPDHRTELGYGSYYDSSMEHQQMGYGLGVLSPMSFPRATGIQVVKTLVGDYDSAAADHKWQFTLDWKTTPAADSADLVCPTSYKVIVNGVDETNNADRVVSRTGNGFVFVAKAGEPVTINFEYTGGNVYYSITETDPETANYATTAKLNGAVVGSNSASGNTSLTNAQYQFINSAGVTISKEATGFAADEEFGFDILCTKTDPGTGYPLPLSFAEAGEASMIKSNGSETTVDLSGTATGFNRAPFSLKNGESVRFLIPGEWNYQITETNANVGCVTTANDTELEGDAKNYYASTASSNPTVKFVNTKDPVSGRAHLLIDYNLNGIPATESSSVTGTTVAMSQVNKDPVDCGDLEVGTTYTFGLAIQGSPLTVDQKVNFSVLNEADGKTYNVTAKFLGLSETANGAVIIGKEDISPNGEFSYTIQDKADSLNVLYCRWEFSMYVQPHDDDHDITVGTNYNMTTMCLSFWYKIDDKREIWYNSSKYSKKRKELKLLCGQAL